MKVKDIGDVRRIDGTRTSESRKTPGGAPSAAEDRVSTAATSEVDAAVSAARQALGESRAVRLEAIEKAVREGSFRPDPQRIAQRILDEAEITAMLQAMLQR